MASANCLILDSPQRTGSAQSEKKVPAYLRLSARSAGKQGECQFQWQAQIALSLVHHREHGVHRVKKGACLSATISEICGKTGGKSISMASANCLILDSPQRTRSAQSEKKCLLICDYQRDLRENRGKVYVHPLRIA